MTCLCLTCNSQWLLLSELYVTADYNSDQTSTILIHVMTVSLESTNLFWVVSKYWVVGVRKFL